LLVGYEILAKARESCMAEGLVQPANILAQETVIDIALHEDLYTPPTDKF